MFNQKRNNIVFRTKNCSQLTAEEIMMCSELFSHHYGVYSKNSPKNPGQQIKLSPNYYKNHFVNNISHYPFVFAVRVYYLVFLKEKECRIAGLLSEKILIFA